MERRVSRTALLVALAVLFTLAVPGAPALAETRQFVFTDAVGEVTGAPDISEVTAWWDAGGPLTLEITFANVSAGSFEEGHWVEIALDVDRDSAPRADYLVQFGSFPFSDDHAPRLCERFEDAFSCTRSDSVDVGWVTDTTIRVATEGTFFGDSLAFRVSAIGGPYPGPVDTLFDVAKPIIVYIEDTTPPVMQVATDHVVLWATQPDGNAFNLGIVTRGVDDIDPDPTVTCDPPSGSVFPIGDTTVTCFATDAAGNVSAPVSLVITVLGPSEILMNGAESLRTMAGVSVSGFARMFEVAASHLDAGRNKQACRLLDAFRTAGGHVIENGSTELPTWALSTADRVANSLLLCDG